MNGELRDRERVMRTLEETDTPILSGMQIYYNYVRPHEALKGKTPSEVAGIRVVGENKWLILIQNANQKYLSCHIARWSNNQTTESQPNSV